MNKFQPFFDVKVYIYTAFTAQAKVCFAKKYLLYYKIRKVAHIIFKGHNTDKH